MLLLLFFVEKSTDVELRDLLLELCQTQPPGSQVHSQSHSHSQSQAYPSSQSQSIGELKLQQLQRSHSLLSAHSLFQEESGGEEEGEEREIEDLSSPENSGDRDRLEGRDTEGDDRVEVDSGDDLFIAMETELDSSKYSSPAVKISIESEQQQQQVTPPKPTTAQSKLHLDLQLNKRGGGGGGRRGTPVSPFRSPKPPHLRYKAAEETDEESEVDLPISTPLASPIPPSPKSKELQSDILKELDSFSSSCNEVGRELEGLGGLTDSQFGVPYSQLQTPSTSQYSKSHPELDKVWNSTPAAVARENPLDTQSPLKLVGEGTGVGGGRGIGLGQSVQLEYDMPEITASQLETSSDPLFIAPLENDSPRSSLTKGHHGALMKGQNSSSRGQSPLVMHQQTSSSTSSSRKAKRQLLRGSSAKGALPKRSVAGRTRSKRKHKDKDIPQLDGTDDRQLPSSATTLSRKRKRTLGLQHKRRKQTKSSREPAVEARLLNEEEVGSTSSEMEEQLTSLPEAAVEETATGSDTREREEVLPSSAATLLLNEGKGTTGPVLPKEEDLLYGGNVECGLVEMEVWKSGQGESCEASGDESGQQSTREKARLSLSLKKSANRTHRTRESDPDLVVAETVINPSWRAEGDDLLRGSEVVPGPSSPVRTRERATHPEVACSPSRKVSQHLKEQVLRRRPILKLDKLSTRLSVQRSMKENAAVALTKDAGEQTRKKPSSKRRKMSATSMSSGSSEADLTNERERRYKKRCRERSTRSKWSPKFLLGMSYEQQLKRAIEISKQTYVAESTQQQLQYDAESAELLQDDDAESAQRQDGVESTQLQLSDDGQEGSGGLEWEEPGELGPGSPLMFSPPSTGDADRTVIEESPLREEERGLDDRILNVDDFLDKSCLDERREEGEETETAAAVVVGEGINEWNLDMSISSISESPPYTSSPALAAEGAGREREGEEGEKAGGEEEELLHDSTLKLELETSFTELSSPPPQSSSPIPVTPKPPFDVDTSFLSEDSFPCVSLASNVAAHDINNQTTLAIPSDPSAKVTIEDDEDTPSQPTTPSKTTCTEMEAVTNHDHPNQPLLSDYPPVASMLHSPDGSESQSEAEQIFLSQLQADVSIVSEEDFHLSIGSCSSSSHEDEIEGGRDSPDPLNFSIEKTSRAVRLEQYLLPRESQYQAKDKIDRRPHSLQVEKDETAASNVFMFCDNDESELVPPTHRELAQSASSYGLPSMHHQEPFYSCPADAQRPL